jgi:exonuclease III
LSVTIQNCNSLNLTGSTANFDLKLAAIVQSRADVILLSDTRIITNKGVSASEKIAKCLRDCKIRQYSAYFNSNANSRGVAVLIGNNLEYTIREEYRDDAENFLMVDITINGKSYGIGAVYGPNNTSREFFNVMKRALNHMKNKGISDFIIGGDWNATVDRRPVIHNIDTFHMSGLPNPKNSELLEDLCRDFSLLDPYRVLYPYKRDYTYSPFGTVRLNRSRIDFYLISATMIDSINDCVIAESMACKLFDHKQVSLYLNNPRIRKIKTDRLSNSYLSENLLRFSVEIATRRAHIYSLLCNGFYPLNAQIKETEVNKINLALSTYKELVRSMEKAAAEGRDERMDLIIAGQEQQIKLQFDDMLPIITLERLAKSCNPAEFFVALTAEIRKSGSRTQKF